MFNHSSTLPDNSFFKTSFFNFSYPKGFGNYSFSISTDYATADGNLNSFCYSSQCKIPIIFGGLQYISIYNNSYQIMNFSVEENYNFRLNCDNSSWERRICQFRNVCILNETITFFAPYQIYYNISNPFLVLGGRPPPYDRKKDRIRKINFQIGSTYPPNCNIYHHITHLASTYYNMHMLWHSIFDFLLPLFHTTLKYNSVKQQPLLILPKNSDWSNTEYAKFFVRGIKPIQNNICYEELIVGISKVKDEIGNYDFPKNFTYKLMPYIWKYYGKKPSIPKNHVITFINRKNSRSIINLNELIFIAKNFSKGSTVQSVVFEDMPMQQQIITAYQSDIIIGVHGSGLSHLAWMRPSSSILEIFPYKFNCRDWYQKASYVSGIKYFKYYPQSSDESPNPSPSAKRCWNLPHECSRSCLDPLRDQNIKVNETAFRSLLSAIIKQ